MPPAPAETPVQGRLLPRLRQAHEQLARRDLAGQTEFRVLLGLLFERCAAARGRVLPGGAIEPQARATLTPLLADLPVDWARWTGRELGAVYTALLDERSRRQAGIYYTPPIIVETILAATLDPILAAILAAPAPLVALRELRICDPACGAGAFLVATVARLAAALASADPGRHGAGWWAATAASCVYGADSDPVAADLVRYSVCLYIWDAGGVAPADLHLHCGDALTPLPPGWANFDAVVGNPPYLACRAQARAAKAGHRAHYRTAHGQYDLSVLFIERGLDLLRAGGVLGYIVPNKFMAADYGRPLRALLAAETSILHLEDVSQDDLFPGAATYPVILVARKAPPLADHALVLAGPRRSPAILPQAAFCALDGGILPAAVTPLLLELAQHLATQPERLPAGAIRCGIARAGHARAALDPSAYARLAPAEQAGYLPLLQTQDIMPYTVRAQVAPRYLPRTAMTQGQREAAAQPKVLIPGVTRRLLAGHTPGGQALGRVYYILDGAVPYDPFALLAVLNSRVLAWYYRFLYWPVHLSGGYLRVNGPYLAHLPLPPRTAPLARDLAALGHARAVAPDEATAIARQATLDAIICRCYDIAPADLAAAETTLASLTSQ